MPVFVVHRKEVPFFMVAATGDGYTLLWKLSLDLVFHPELSQSPNGQVFCRERSSATEGELQVTHPCEVEEHLQHGGVCEPNGQVTIVVIFFHGRRQHRSAVAHQVCQVVITVTDIRQAAAVPNYAFLGEN